MTGNLKQVIAFAAALIFGTLILFVGGGSQPSYLIAYSVIMLVGVILAWNLSQMFREDMPWYSPHIMVLVFFFLFEFAAPVNVIFFGYGSAVYKRPLLPEEIFPATMVALVGVLAYLIGWRIGPKGNHLSPTLQKMLSDTPSVMSMAPALGIVFIVFSVLAWAYMYSTVGGLSAHLDDIGSSRGAMVGSAGGFVWHTARFGLVATLMYFAVKGPKSIMSWIMIGVMALILGLFGSRSYLLTLLVGALVVYRMRFTYRTPKTVLIVSAAILFIIATFLVQFRATGGDLGGAQTRFVQYLQSPELFAKLIFGDMTFIIQRSEIMRHLNETGDYQYGSTYLNLLQIIPGIIWPSKYEVLPPTGGQYYVETFFPRRVGRISLSNNIFTELFLNFSWLGVLLGGAVFGFVIRWLHSRIIVPLGRHNHVITASLIGIMTVTWLQLIKSGSPVLLDMFYLTFPLIVLSVINLMFGQFKSTE